MKNDKTKVIEKEITATEAEKATDKSAALKKNKKTKQTEETPAVALKVKKVKAEKVAKEAVEPKKQKAQKDDKLTKFLVSMKKSVRKSLKKEAAEAGVSMNEYIVLAVVDKLRQDSANS